MIWDATERVDVDGAQLMIYDRGAGEPVVFIHGSMGDECAAVLEQPALADSFRLIHYHRPGFGRSQPSKSPLSIEQQAGLCRAVMQHVGLERVHVVGQSGGGVIALQLALESPDAVKAAALLEAAVPAALNGAATLERVYSESVALYETGDAKGAVETFAREVCGADYRSAFDVTLPDGYFDRWAAEIESIFSDAAAEEAWTFTREAAARITCPVLNMTGAETRPYLRNAYELLGAWLPRAENVVLPDATHAMLQTNPQGAAKHMADFFSRYPMGRC